jgi:riboflavin synthase alpha subunit
VFTGIIEGQGSLLRLEVASAEGERLELEVDVGSEIASDVRIGDSIALSGCCLTVTGVRETVLAFQAVPETLRLTSLGDRAVGDRINVERSMRADARFGGHIVQGHVDGTGRVAAVRQEGDEVQLRIDCPEELARLLVQKGSVAVDGVSETTLGAAKQGDRVNLEVDVLGKYVFSYLDRIRDRS